jgi:WD40 repeat protein
MPDEDRVVIYDQDTKEQREIEIESPWTCASSQHILAIITLEYALHIFSPDGDLIHIVPGPNCVTLHPYITNILAVGYANGTVCLWDLSTQASVSTFKQHIMPITNIRFALDGQLLLSSYDHTAAIVALDDQFQIVSSVKFEGHTARANDILLLSSSNQCITCSEDTTIKVWDCETGTCLRTLTEHTAWVNSLAMHPYGRYFASGADEPIVIIWSCETFEVLQRLPFPSFVQSLDFGESDTLYAAVDNHGVMSCNFLTGEIGPVIIPGTGDLPGLALGVAFVLFSLYSCH